MLALLQSLHKLGLERLFRRIDGRGDWLARQCGHEPMMFVMPAKKTVLASRIASQQHHVPLPGLHINDRQADISGKLDVKVFAGPVRDDVNRQWTPTSLK